MNLRKESIEVFLEQGKMGRHETFTPRYGWLKKGFDAVNKDKDIFKQPDAIVELGVGKNMVNSIRFWCLAFKLISSDMEPIELGKNLLGDNGWDPYLEDDASLWLLHWQLFIPPFDAVSWPLAFNHCNLRGFGIKELSRTIFNAAQPYPNLARISERTFERDASCIIRMYVDEEEKHSEIECPFTQLGLMYRTGEKNQVCFDFMLKHSLSPLILAAACFSYAANYLVPGQKNISLQRLVFGLNSPGIVFKLPETVIGNYLEVVSKQLRGFSLVSHLGNMQLHFHESPNQLYIKAVTKYYTER